MGGTGGIVVGEWTAERGPPKNVDVVEYVESRTREVERRVLLVSTKSLHAILSTEVMGPWDGVGRESE